jgi:hypothetical protein
LISFDSSPPPGNADVGAWESPRDDIDFAHPFDPVEISDVSEDWELWENAVGLSLLEDLLAVGFDFNCCDSCVSEEVSTKDASTGSSEEV